MHTSSRLKEERERLGYNQTDFATLAHATRKTLFNWESGAGSPSADALNAWVAVGLDVLYVVTGQHAAAKPMPADEQMWLDCYRGWEMPVKRKELARALGLPPTGALVAEPVAPAVLVSGNQQHNTGHGVVQIGSMGQPAVKKRR